jgi:AraC-like DNA-binding protein
MADKETGDILLSGAEYAKMGYLEQEFKLFHLRDTKKKEFDFHYHDFNKIVIFLQGEVSYTVEGQTYHLSPFDLVLVRSGELHRPVIHSNKLYERIIIYISPEFIAKYTTPQYDLEQCFHLAAQASTHVLRIPSLKGSTLYHTVKALENTYANPSEYAQPLNQRLLFLQLMIQLNRAVLKHDSEFIQTNTSNKKIVECIDYINTHLQEPISPDSLAKQFYLSKYHLMHCFKEETGCSIGSYLSTKRLLLAREYIQEGMSATQACYECGFHNYSTFFRAWKKCFGNSPTSKKEMWEV